MKWDMEDRNLKMTRPAFGGHLMATIICPRFRPCMATVRPGVMKKNAYDEAKANAVEIVKPNFTLTAEDIHTDVTEVVKAAKKLVDLIGADDEYVGTSFIAFHALELVELEVVDIGLQHLLIELSGTCLLDTSRCV